MKKRIIWIIIILSIIITIFTKCVNRKESGEEFKPIDLNVGDEFTEISYPNKMYVVNYDIVDMTGDDNNDMVIVIGEKENVADTLSKNIDVILYDTSTSKFSNVGLKNFSGNNLKVQTADYTGDGTKDVILIVQNEDNTYNIRAFTYMNTKMTEIFKDRNNRGVAFEGEFLDGFKVNIINRKLNKEFKIELADRKDNYVKSSFYDESGKLKKESARISTSKFIEVEPVQLNDRYGIKTRQRITGFDDLDIIDEIEVVWKYEDGKWQMKEAKGSKIGNLLY